MCGIAGEVIVRGTRQVEYDSISAMTDALSHRGPDASGVFVTPEKRVGLGHTRLSIVDPSAAAHQPMQKHNLVLTFNGEIFNAHEVRSKLEKEGYTFSTKGDTEVLLSAFHRWGIASISEFNGFFAFVLHDCTKDETYVVRDRVGIKQIAYTEVEGSLLFASEVKALARHPLVSLSPDVDRIVADLILRFWGDKERTYFKGIRHLEPGSFLHIKNGSITQHTYWSIAPFLSSDELRSASEEAIVEEFSWLLNDAVSLRIKHGTTPGSILSGGLDSSLITELATHHISSPLRTVTLQYGDEVNEDLRMSELLASHNKRIERTVVPLSGDYITGKVKEVTFAMEEVLHDKVYFSIFRNYQQTAALNLRSVINGQGADELWLGYYFTYALMQVPEAEHTVDGLIRFFRSQALLPRLLPVRADELIEETLTKHLLPFQHQDFLNGLVALSIRTHLQSIVMQEDRLSMAHAVECRVPYLDHRLVELSCKVPGRLKIKDGREKYIVRTAGARHLPAPIVNRQKFSFPHPPVSFEQEADRYVADFASQPHTIARELLGNGVAELYDQLSSIERWKIYALAKFEETFFGDYSPKGE